MPRLHALFLIWMSWGAASTLDAQTAFTVRNAKTGGNFLWGIASGPSGFVAVGDGGTILTSPTGTTWTRQTSGITDWLVGVAYGAGQYVAVGDHGRILSSTDGVTWNPVVQTATTARLNNVIYAGGKFVSVGESGTILTSTDAHTWTAQNSGVTTWLHGQTYISPSDGLRDPTRSPVVSVNGGYWVCGQNSVLLRSLDGENWTNLSGTIAPGTNGGGDLEAITGSSFFAAVGQDGTVVADQGAVYYSKTPGPNGLPVPSLVYQIYRTPAIEGSARFRGLIQGANALFATGENGMIASTPYINNPWTSLDSGTTSNLVAGVFSGNSLYVVGENETVLQSTPLYFSRLLNISTRGQVGTGGNILISGLVITGTTPKKLLIRAAGPALANFSVAGALTAPVLTVLDAGANSIATNTGWSTASNPAAIASTAAQVGAFPFTAGAADSAVLVTLNPGSYTVQVTGVNSSTGIALVEAYDADGLANDSARAVNISTRGLVGTAGSELIAGFNIGGAASRRVLIRAVGPSLTAFGVPGPLAKPVIEIRRTGSTSVAYTAQGSWSAQTNADEIRGAAILSGAFALTEDSQDAALVVTLAPGSYTAVVRGLNNTTGVALVEVYDLP